MKNPGQLKEVMRKEKADFADFFHESSISTTIIFEDNKIDRLITGVSGGSGTRIIKGKETDYSFVSDNEVKDIEDRVPIEEKIKVVENTNKAARAASKYVTQVTVSYADTVQSVTVSNSNGTQRSGKRIRTRFLINVIAQKDGIIQTGYETAGGTVGFYDLFKDNDPEALARKAAGRAEMMLFAKYAPSGKMPVVIKSEAGGTLIHEACGHGLEADFIYKNTSVYAGKVGQKIASDLITVIDDATIPRLYGSFEFDDEGTPSQKKILIENGILKGFMCDIYNSMMLGIPSTGNGRRESFCTRPQPRMTNTYIERGRSDPSEIISSIKKGLLVDKLGGGQVNVVNGDFVFEVQEGHLIENGKIKEPVRGAMLIGNGPKILMDIDMVGNDLNFITGTCGKGDHAPVTDAMPTVRIPEIVVGGRQ